MVKIEIYEVHFISHMCNVFARNFKVMNFIQKTDHLKHANCTKFHHEKITHAKNKKQKQKQKTPIYFEIIKWVNDLLFGRYIEAQYMMYSIDVYLTKDGCATVGEEPAPCDNH